VLRHQAACHFHGGQGFMLIRVVAGKLQQLADSTDDPFHDDSESFPKSESTFPNLSARIKTRTALASGQ
jgi:hypothetical protein